MAEEVSAKAVVRFFGDELEAGLLIDMVRGMENALRPERHSFVTAGAGEGDALCHQRFSKTKTTRSRFNKKHAQLGNAFAFRMTDKKDAAETLAIALGDPAALAPRIEVSDEVGGDAGNEGFESLVPAVVLRIHDAIARDYPAHVAGAMRTENEGGAGGRMSVEQVMDGLHGADDAGTLPGCEARESFAGLVGGEAVETGKGRLPFSCEPENDLAGICSRRSTREELLFFEFCEDAAQVAGIEVELGGDFSGAGASRAAQFVEHTRLSERAAVLQELIAEQADDAGVEAIESTVGGDGMIHFGGRRGNFGSGFGWHPR